MLATRAPAFNHWDRSQIDYNSGSAYIAFGFQNCQGCPLYGYSGSFPQVWTLRRVDFNEANGDLINAYNRVYCAYSGPDYLAAYAYVQCRAIIF